MHWQTSTASSSCVPPSRERSRCQLVRRRRTDRVGVNHVVYLSTLGAEKNVIIPHHRIEKHIMGTDITYTLLRASFFMQNLLEVHRADIVEHDELFVPAGSGKTSFIDARHQ